jgi:hypothetical protein
MKINNLLFNFIKNNNIIQKYKYIDDNLKEYTDLTKNTIFYCENDFDYQLLKIHLGNKYQYVDNINNFIYIENVYYICNNKEIYNFIKQKTNDVINLNSKLYNNNQINIIKNKKIIFLINCSLKEKYLHRYKLLEHYLKSFNYEYFLLISGINKTGIKNNILYVNIDDIYENLSNKIYEGIKYIYQNTDYEYIYKVDDDFFKVNINLDENEILTDYYANYIINNITRDYHRGKCFDNELNENNYNGIFYNKYGAGGYGYVISRKSMFYIVNNKNYITNELYEDKAIGDVLFKNNIFINNNNYKELKYKKPEKIIPILSTNKKYAVIMYHKNIKKIYKWRWISKSVNTILDQTYNDFDIFEINYGGEDYSIFNDIKTNKNIYFYSKKYNTHTEAMTYLLNECFYNYNYDVVFNTNLDDYYHTERFTEQIKCINDGYILCSTLMTYITEDYDDDIIKLEWDQERYGFYNNDKYISIDQIREQLDKNHNVFNHSNICYTKKFWTEITDDNTLLRYRDDKPFEDLSLWQRSVKYFDNITIINKSLIYYRLHENQIGEQNKKEDKDSNVDGGFKLEPSKDKIIVGIFCIGTGNYIQYLDQLIESIEDKFLVDYKKMYFISTDQVKTAENICNKYNVKYNIDFIYKKGFPLDTLYRYKYLLSHDVIVELCCDYIYYLDIDMKIVDTVGEEIFPSKDKPLVGTYHPGFYYAKNKNGDVETNPESTAYIDESEKINKYIAGGFNGGITRYFIDMAKDIQKNIDIDKSNDIIAVWHDESQLNRYMINNNNIFKFLSPDYCFPENYWQELPGHARILALDKQHHQIRNTFNKKHILVNAVGGLGNLLFQLFFAYNIAFRYNLDVVINVEQKDELRESVYFYHLFDNITRIKVNEDVHNENFYYKISEMTKNYSDHMINIPFNKNIYLTGFFQSALYFKDNFERIKKHFDFKILNIAKDIIKKYNCDNKKLVALHIRGGDYIEKSDYHKLLPKSYYEKCLSSLDLQNCNIILFTDDYNYAFNNYSEYFNIDINEIIKNNINKEYEYLINNSELSLFLMSCCDTIICANSTFSLWASYFSNSEKIFIPREWFGPKGPQNFTTDEFKLNNNYVVV